MSDVFLRWSDIDLPAVNKAFDEFMRQRAESRRNPNLGPAPKPVVVLCQEVPPKRPGGVTQWRFWCGWCGKWHFHGAGAGHRVAHCTSMNSPYLRSGYILKLARKQT
jgi:hypothetical protein